MPSEIVGYASRAYVKGQYYRYAGAPKPDSFTGNIDEVGEDLLVKAMYVTRSQAAGTFPDDTINDYLIETVKYGNSSYLQIAYAIQQGYDCYEYKRIYSGAWTEWVGVDSNIATAARLATGAANVASQAAESASSTSSQLSTLKNNVSSLSSNVTSLSNSVSTLSSSVTTLNSKTTMQDISNSYVIEKTGGDSKFSFENIEANKVGNIVSMRFTIHMSSSSSSNTWSVGTNLFKGKINSGSLPTQAVRLISYYGSSILLCNIEANGDITVRVFGSTLTIGNRSDNISHTGVFMVAN